jgi:hypothetical protein
MVGPELVGSPAPRPESAIDLVFEISDSWDARNTAWVALAEVARA